MPYFSTEQTMPLWSKVVHYAINAAIQCYPTDEEDNQDEIREKCRDVSCLQKYKNIFMV